MNNRTHPIVWACAEVSLVVIPCLLPLCAFYAPERLEALPPGFFVTAALVYGCFFAAVFDGGPLNEQQNGG